MPESFQIHASEGFCQNFLAHLDSPDFASALKTRVLRDCLRVKDLSKPEVRQYNLVRKVENKRGVRLTLSGIEVPEDYDLYTVVCAMSHVLISAIEEFAVQVANGLRIVCVIVGKTPSSLEEKILVDWAAERCSIEALTSE